MTISEAFSLGIPNGLSQAHYYATDDRGRESGLITVTRETFAVLQRERNKHVGANAGVEVFTDLPPLPSGRASAALGTRTRETRLAYEVAGIVDPSVRLRTLLASNEQDRNTLMRVILADILDILDPGQAGEYERHVDAAIELTLAEMLERAAPLDEVMIFEDAKYTDGLELQVGENETIPFDVLLYWADSQNLWSAVAVEAMATENSDRVLVAPPIELLRANGELIERLQ